MPGENIYIKLNSVNLNGKKIDNLGDIDIKVTCYEIEAL